MTAGAKLDNLFVGTTPDGSGFVHDQVGGIRAVGSIAALRALTTADLLVNPGAIISVNGWAQDGDSDQGRFQYVSSNHPSDNGATVFVDSSNRQWVRLWDLINFPAAWAGMLPSTADIGPLFVNLPQYAYIGFQAGQYTVASYPSQVAFSNKFYRGQSTIWNCTGSLLPDFDTGQIAFNWVYTAKIPISNANSVPGLPLADMTNSGISPIEGMGIISQGDGNSGVGITFGMPIPAPNWGEVRSTTSKTTELVYFEYQVPDGTGNIGLSTSAYDIVNGNLGAGPSVAYGGGGPVYCNGSIIGTSAPYAPGNWIGVAANTTTRQIWCKNISTGSSYNANSSANPTTGVGGFDCSALSGPLFVTAVIQSYQTLGNVNFGGSAFQGSVPASFSVWGAGATFNPSDQSNLLFYNGNLTLTAATQPLSSNYPEAYMIDPGYFGASGFYVNVGFLSPTNCFLTGLRRCYIHGGNIGVIYVGPGSNSGENMQFIGNDVVGTVNDAYQIFVTNGKCTINGGSIDYCHRALLQSEASVFLVNLYSETTSTSTPGSLIATEGQGMMTMDSGSTLLFTGAGSSNSDYVDFNGNGNPTVAYFNNVAVNDAHPSRQSAVSHNTAFANAYGTFVGFNATNFAMAVSGAQLLQTNCNFATGDLTGYPGSSGATVITNPVFGETFAVSLTGVAHLNFQTMRVVAGQIIKVSLFDYVAGTVVGLAGSMVFTNDDGLTLATTAFSTTSSIPNFEASALAPHFTTTTRTNFQLERFVFLVPPGATKMTGSLSTASGTTGQYIVSDIFIYP